MSYARNTGQPIQPQGQPRASSARRSNAASLRAHTFRPIQGGLVLDPPPVQLSTGYDTSDIRLDDADPRLHPRQTEIPFGPPNPDPHPLDDYEQGFGRRPWTKSARFDIEELNRLKADHRRAAPTSSSTPGRTKTASFDPGPHRSRSSRHRATGRTMSSEKHDFIDENNIGFEGRSRATSRVTRPELDPNDIQAGLAANDDGSSRSDRDRGEIDHFALAHGSERHFHASHHPLGWRHLFKRPIVRQWLYGGDLYKSAMEREATYVELFFDLMFVGIIHQLAEAALEPVSGESVALFVLTFYPSWSIWSDVRTFINHSGVDDVPQRLYILVIMVILVGYSASVSSIELVSPSDPTAETLEPSPQPGEPPSETFTTPRILESFVLSPEFHKPLRAAVGFLLVAKALRLAAFVIYAAKLPKFRRALVISSLQLLLPCAFWLPLVWVTTPSAVMGLAIAAILVERGWPFVGGFIAKLDRKRAIFGGRDWFVPANAVEHSMERMSAFMTLVLGEIVINSTYSLPQDSTQFGVSGEYGRAALAIIIAFELMWIYFDADSARAYIHALRRHWVTSILSTNLHWPLASGIILMSAAMRDMVGNYEVENGLHWYFAGGIAVAVLSTALLGWLHLSLDAPRTSILPRHVRLLMRVVVAAIFATFPLYGTTTDLSILGIHAGVLAVLIVVETVGKLGAESIDAVELEGRTGGKWGRFGHGVRKEDLTDAERGELDIGVEEGLEKVEVRAVQPHQVLAYTAS